MSRGGVFDTRALSTGPLPAKRARYDDDRPKGGKGGKFGPKGGKGGGKSGKGGKGGGAPHPLSVFRAGAPGPPKGKGGWDASRPPRQERPAEDLGPLDEGLVLDIQNFLEEHGGQANGGQISAAFFGVRRVQLKPHFDVVDTSGGRYWVRLKGSDGPLPEDSQGDDASKLNSNVLAAEGPEEEEAEDMPDEFADDAVADPYVETFPDEAEDPLAEPFPDEAPAADAEDDDEYIQSLERRVEDLQQELADVLAAKGLREEDLPSSRRRSSVFGARGGQR